MQKRDFLENLAIKSYVVYWRLIGSYAIGLFYWIPKSKMAEIRHLENRHDVIFFCRRWFDLDKISDTGAEWHVDCGDLIT